MGKVIKLMNFAKLKKIGGWLWTAWMYICFFFLFPFGIFAWVVQPLFIHWPWNLCIVGLFLWIYFYIMREWVRKGFKF